jgi:purine-cytosine permease-like protein
VLEIYSSGLSLLSMGVPLPRALAVALDGLVMTVAVVYVVFFAPGDFFTQFQGFVITLAVPISAWAGIMLADVLLRKADYDENGLFDRSGRYGAYQWPTIAIFLVASFVGFGLVTNMSAGWLTWQGYLLDAAGGRTGPWAEANLGVIVALLLGFAGYAFARRRAVVIQDRPDRDLP